MKKLYILSSILLIAFVFVYSCSTEEEDTSPPPALVQPQEPEPDPTQYTLTVTAEEGGSVSTEGGTYDEGTDITISAFPDGCYGFSQWSDGITSNERVITLNKNIDLSAQFESLVNNIEYSGVNLKFPCAYNISIDKSYNETEKYKVGPSAWLSASVLESHQEFYYPTNNDYNPPGFFELDPNYFSYGDFNNDGLTDLLIDWATFTHTLERESRFNFTILLNNGDGSMSYDHQALESNSIHYNHFAYRAKVADFNNDGYDDFASASMGLNQRLPGQDSNVRWERIPLILNNGDGTFYDASFNIEGQEDRVSPPQGHTFSHELSVGDVDGDGDIDIYAGKVLLLNDGIGNFKNVKSELINELRPSRNLWSSVIADFNNDGVDDFFIPFAETTGASWEDYIDSSGFYSLSIDGGTSYKNSHTGFVSDAKYGIQNTKFNHAIAYDINSDGFKDVIIGVTRANPYYVGKNLQLYLNVPDSNSNNRKFESADYLLPDMTALDQFHGSGQLAAVDINNDGVLDIVHSSGARGDEYGLTYYINNGGILELFNTTDFPYLGSEQFPGFENFGNNDKLRRSYPIDLNKKGWIDYISTVQLNYGDGRKEKVFYSVIAK